MLREGEEMPSETQLERWRRVGYIPTTEPIGDRTTRYPPETAKHVVALLRALDAHKGSLHKAAIELFFDGREIGVEAMHAAVTHELAAVRKGLERNAGTWRGKDAGHAPPLQTAAALARKMMRPQVRRESAAHRRQMTSRLERSKNPDAAVGTVNEQLESALTGLWYVFLCGKWLPQSKSVVPQVFIAFAGEDLTMYLKSTFGVELPVILPALADQLCRVSLPRVEAMLKRMTAADYVIARHDYMAIMDICVFFIDAVRALQPTKSGVPKPLRAEMQRVARLLTLPALFDLRRRYRERLELAVAISRELPQWRATLDEARASGALASADQRARALSDIREAMQPTES